MPAATPRRSAGSARRWASMKQTADYLSVTDRTVRQMMFDGRLTSYRNGSRLVRIDLNEVDAAMEPSTT